MPSMPERRERSSGSAPGDASDEPNLVVSCATSTSSRTPMAARSDASRSMDAADRLLNGPRSFGIAQYEHLFEQPSAIFRYAVHGGVASRRG